MSINLGKVKRISIVNNDIIEAALIIACAWGKLSWGWFWLMVFLDLVACVGREYDA